MLVRILIQILQVGRSTGPITTVRLTAATKPAMGDTKNQHGMVIFFTIFIHTMLIFVFSRGEKNVAPPLLETIFLILLKLHLPKKAICRF